MKLTTRARVAILVATASLLFGGVLVLRSGSRRAATKLRPPAEERCDDNGWCTQSPAHADTMRAVWAAAPDDVWTVDMGGSAWHFDGVKWTSRFTGIKFPAAVFGFGPKAVWMVGGQQAVFWDGTQFVPFKIRVRGALAAVFGTQPNDVWASSGAGVVAHFNGHDWTVVGTPFNGWLHAIWGAKSDDIWVAGGQGEDEPSNTILHYDGKSFTAQQIPCKCDITGLSGTARDDVWAVGSWGTILHFDGREWSRVPSPVSRGLTAVWAASRTDVWAVGEQGMVLHYAGKAWTAAKPDWKWFWGIAGTATRELWAVGQDGWILHWHGDKFRGLPKPDAPAAAADSAASASNTPNTSKPAAPSPDGKAAAALARARKLQHEGKIEQALAAFVDATGHGEVVNLQPLAEYAYALLQQGNGDTYGDVESMLLTATKGDDSQLKAQAWFNLGLLYEKRNEPEAERAALAHSLALRDHRSVRAKLRGRSNCVAEIGKRHMWMNPLTVSGWKAVCTSLDLCNPGESLSAAQARAKACVTSSGVAGAPDESHGCEGEGPWKSTYRYSLYRNSAAWIAPLSGNRFFVAQFGEGGWPAICAGFTQTEWERLGDYAVVTARDESMSRMLGRLIPQSGDPDAVCLELPARKSIGVYSVSTSKLLAAASAFDEDSVELTVDADQRRLIVTGGGCDGHVPLDGSMRLVATLQH